MKDKHGMTETDLAKEIIQWLIDQHWEVYQEVQIGYGGIADIMAVQNNILWVIECKTSFSLKVIDQARKWQSHYRSIAVPQFGSFSDIHKDILKTYKLGILTVYMKQSHRSVEEFVQAPLMREYHKSAKKMISKLLPEHKTYAEAGNNHGIRYTPYRHTMDNAKRIVKQFPGITVKEMVDKLDHYHYAERSVKTSILSALKSFESDWCDIRLENHKTRLYLREGK